jgi:hypothetical protein
MAFPDISTLSPQDGAIHIIGENKFVFSSATGKWEKATLNPTARFDPPAVPYNGQLWFDTDTTGRLYMWNEGATSWIQLTGHQLDGGGNATTGYVDTAISNLIDSSPETLNTLNEISAAIGDDPNFVSSMTTSVSGKLNTADFDTTADSWLETKTLNNIGNVSISSGINGQVLTYQDGWWYPANQLDAESQGAVMESDTTTASMSFVIDEGSMSSNLSTRVPTQRSVKQYVDDKFTSISGMSLATLPGNMDNISDGSNFVKTQNNYTTAEKAKLIGINPLTAAQQGAVMSYSVSVNSYGFVIDENDLSSNTQTKVPTQRSVKTYVDNVKTYVDDREQEVIDTHIPNLAVLKSGINGSAQIPAGNTSQRDSSPSTGFFRWNNELGNAEIYDGAEWGLVGGGNTTGQVLWEHAQNITEDYVIENNNNAVTAGTITIDANSSIEIPSGSTWALV